MSECIGYSDWSVEETEFNDKHCGKFEAIMCLGNGYMGIRSATEEKYITEKRNTFIAGTFNRFDEHEVPELPNLADVIQMDIFLNGEILDLTKGIIKGYQRKLNLKTGTLERTFIWTNDCGEAFEMAFQRIVSFKKLHVIGQNIIIKPLNTSLIMQLNSGINGQMTNSGVQHFTEGEKRLINGKIMQYEQVTTQSQIRVMTHTGHRFFIDEVEQQIIPHITMDRRIINTEYELKIGVGKALRFEKISTHHTTRDFDVLENQDYGIKAYEDFKEAYELGYPHLFEENSKTLYKELWADQEILIENKNSSYDQLAIRFAQFHLKGMTPSHDPRMNVAAKGLSGEGYKGHTFWDTEIFILPYFTFTQPGVAKSLLKYRFLTLEGAYNKAKDNGYKGAMFPWESAWLDDGEVTPIWGGADIVTGEITKIWSGFIEQHITADVTYAIWQYFQVTGDVEFLKQYGLKIIFETAVFWASRLEYNESLDCYEIKNVIGPDEYKEHIDNNAFTNYMAHWTIELALTLCEQIKENEFSGISLAEFKTEIGFDTSKVYDVSKDFDATLEHWKQILPKIVLPKPNEDWIIPQDDTYLSKKIIDLTKYKDQKHVGSFFKDYNLDQANEIQVSKQADIMILFYLMEHLFEDKVKRANWDYYEPKTLHDSSLSLSTHAVLAADFGDLNLAYDLFSKASEIDLGTNMKSSDHGLHAASLGGLWQCVVNGFGGVRNLNGTLRIEPKLPKDWDQLSFNIKWQESTLKITVTRTQLRVDVLSSSQEIEYEHKGVKYFGNCIIKLG